MDLIEVTANINRHPWELSRVRCMLKEIKRIKNVGCVLDIGCGDGYFDRQLFANDCRVRSLLGYDLHLKEPYTDGKCTWTNDFSDVNDNEYDLIIMMDVLEHVKDDVSFFRQVCRKLKPQGYILITVPAFMKLYSLHDKELKHYRRYDRKMLRSVVSSDDCFVIDESYFYLSLIPLRILTRNKTENLGIWKYGRNHFATILVERILNFDYDMLRFLSKMNVYIGGLSLLMLVRKNRNGKKQTS